MGGGTLNLYRVVRGTLQFGSALSFFEYTSFFQSVTVCCRRKLAYCPLSSFLRSFCLWCNLYCPFPLFSIPFKTSAAALAVHVGAVFPFYFFGFHALTARW